LESVATDDNVTLMVSGSLSDSVAFLDAVAERPFPVMEIVTECSAVTVYVRDSICDAVCDAELVKVLRLGLSLRVRVFVAFVLIVVVSDTVRSAVPESLAVGEEVGAAVPESLAVGEEVGVTTAPRAGAVHANNHTTMSDLHGTLCHVGR